MKEMETPEHEHLYVMQWLGRGILQSLQVHFIPAKPQFIEFLTLKHRVFHATDTQC